MESETEREVRMRLLRMNAVAQGIVMGLLAGLGLFVATNWLVIKGGAQVGPHLALLGQFFPGYTVTFLGSLIGLAYGFVLGFVVGYLFARVYNGILNSKLGRSAG